MKAGLTMKISIINGSPRKNGATSKILKYMKTYLEQKGVETHYVDLSDYDIVLCKGCISCYRTGECVIKEDGIEALADQVKNSDAVIIGSPTYGSDISSYLKAFIDRGHFIVEQSLTHKYGFSVATYEIAEGGQALKRLKKFFLVSGASRLGGLLVKTGFNQDPFLNPRLKSKINSRLEKLYRAVKERKKKTLWEYVFTNVILIPVIWKPKFIKSGNKYDGVLRIWKSKGIIS